MNILVTGATGVVGRRVVPMLVGAGHKVSAAARSMDRLAPLARLGALPLQLDLFDPTAVRLAMEGHDTVINLATSIPPASRALRRSAWRENDRLRRDASRILMDAALVTGVSRFVQESITMTYQDHGSEWIDERVPIATIRANRTVMDAEAAALHFGLAGRVGVVLRFALFYGPDSVHTRETVQLLRRGVAPVLGKREAYLSSLATDDAATAVAAALRVPSGTYNVSDDSPLQRFEYVTALAATLHLPMPRWLPGWLTALMGSGARMLARSQRVSNRRFRQHSGWSPRYRDAVSGFRELVLRSDAAAG